VQTSRAYVGALAELAALGDADERRRSWRQGMAALATAIADHGDAPLEGLDPLGLLAGVRVALADGLVADMDFLTPQAGATAIFALAGGLPPGPERRELGRRTLAQLDTGDAETFVALATALALASRRPLPGAHKRARVAAALSAPLAAGSGADALALALLSSAELERSWLAEPSTGSLPSRRLAARVLERAAREAARRKTRGDDGGVTTLTRPTVRDAWNRLLADREALVWRHAAAARGLLAGADARFADEIERDLAQGAGATGWRRGAASLAARVELEPMTAARVAAFLDGTLPGQDPGVVRGVLTGLAGAFATEPQLADDLAARAIERSGLDAVEGLVEISRELGAVAPRAIRAAEAWLIRARTGEEAVGSRDSLGGVLPPRGGPGGAAAAIDDGHTALLAALQAELGGDAPPGDSLAAQAALARAALLAGRIPDAMAAAHKAADAVADAVEFLERCADDDPIDRRQALRTLRELDLEFLSDGVVIALLARGDDVRAGHSGAARLGELLGRLEAALLARESSVHHGPVPHRTLRFARLRALVRVVDADPPSDDAGALRERRLGVIRALLPRARLDASPLRRAVWAALTRAFDALLRDEQLELSDLLAGWTTAMDADEDFPIAREASMVPEVRAVLDAYAAAMRAASEAADPDDRTAAVAAITAAGGLLTALGAVSSPRTDALRASLGRLLRGLEGLVRARGQREIPATALEHTEAACAVLADLVVGARRRLGLAVSPPISPAAIHALTVAIERQRRGGVADVASDAAVAAMAASDDQVPLIARLCSVAMARLSVLPIDGLLRDPTGQFTVPMPVLTDEAPPPLDDATASLPRWMPPSRTLGGFYVVRALGKGAGGSVFVAVRLEDRHDPRAGQVALKVPDYDGGAARNLSSGEFEAMFRQEAGALLSLPAHRNLAGFVTFDAGARPKPILVMELVAGHTLEQLLELRELDLDLALRLVDGVASGLEAMHAGPIAHLDLKPANVILRGRGQFAMPVLVDFGLAGRRLRPGCGSPHYGAPEVWSGNGQGEPYPADTYALACLVYEIMCGEVLVDGDTLGDVLTAHLAGRAEANVRARLGRDARTAALAELLAAALRLRADQRPTLARLRAGFAAIAPSLAPLPWPLGAS